MTNKINLIIQEMIAYNSLDPKRINHALKVYAFSKYIGELEGIDEETQLILELASILHDIGIKISEEKYNSCAGGYQQIEGPPIANSMLSKFGFSDDVITRVCFLIAHHHTYTGIDNIDYQILIEADFLVNIYEDDLQETQIISIKNKYFKTKAGTEFLENMYLRID